MAEKWHLTGEVLVACNCDWGCPCNFNALPTQGKCEGGWTWHVESGSYDDTSLDGLNFSVYVNWPGAIHIKAGEHLDVKCEPIRNPVTGAESHPGVVLPQGIIFKRGDLGTTTNFRVSNGIEYDHSGKYMGVGEFNYAWP